MDNEYEKLIQFISNFVVLSETDIENLITRLSTKKYSKGAIIVRQGQVCKSLNFVISGIYRVYQIKDGKEITSYFNYNSRNQLVASFTSLLKGQPSTEIVECIVLLAIERIESLQYKSASERYEIFMKLYPDLLNMIPHHYIASYLGVTPESLSRIRKTSLKQ